MEPKRSPASGIGEGYKHVALGGTFAGAIIVFTIGGWALDRWLGLTPLFTLMGTAIGGVLGFLHVYWKLQAEADVERRRRDGEAE